MGNPGWGFKDVLPFFKKSEDFSGENVPGDVTKYHGQGGPLKVQVTQNWQPINEVKNFFELNHHHHLIKYLSSDYQGNI
jgi:choline dehydrogenase-like flavoprotein